MLVSAKVSVHVAFLHKLLSFENGNAVIQCCLIPSPIATATGFKTEGTFSLRQQRHIWGPQTSATTPRASAVVTGDLELFPAAKWVWCAANAQSLCVQQPVSVL